MQKLFSLLFLFLMIFPATANAQNSSVSNQIDELKDKVASKVAELKLVEKRGVIGSVVEVGTNSLTLQDVSGNQIDVTVDELTNYSSDEKNSFDFSDIKKDASLSILGLYNKDSRKILARFVDETPIPLFLRGVISDKDAKNFTITLITMDGTNYLVDVENLTKTLSYNNNNLDDTGFSKIPTDVNAVVVGFENPKEKNRITAGRLIIFPGTPKDPAVPAAKEGKTTPTASK